MPREHEVLWFGIAEVLRVLVKLGYRPPKANDSARLAILLHHEHRWTDLQERVRYSAIRSRPFV